MQEVMTMFMRTTGVTEWGERAVGRRKHQAGAPGGIYPCAGGGPNDYIFLLVVTTRMWDQFCIAIGRDDLLVNPRFQSERLRRESRDLLDAEIGAWTLQRGKHEAMRLLCESGVPASGIFDTMDVFTDPHLAARGFIEQIDHPVEGEITLMKSPIRMSESDVPLQAPPRLGANSKDVLQTDLGLSEAELAALSEAGVVHFAPGEAFKASVER